MVVLSLDGLIEKIVCLTGGYTQEQDDYYSSVLSNLGAFVKHAVDEHTDIVFWEEAVFGETLKLKRAREFNGMGCNIQIYTRGQLDKLLSGEETELEIEQVSNKFTHIAPYAVKADRERVEAYLESHRLTAPANQELLYQLLRYYNGYTLAPQRRWCENIAEQDGLQFSLYKTAIYYLMRTGDYDRAEALCDKLESGKFTTIFDQEHVQNDVLRMRRKIDQYKVKPYWPEYHSQRADLAKIYDERGIPHPAVDEWGHSIRSSARQVRSISSGSSRSIVSSGSAGSRAPKVLSDENLQEIRTSVCTDYSSNEAKNYSFFVSPEVFNIRGIGDHTVNTLLDAGWVSLPGDLFRLAAHRSEMLASGLFTVSKVAEMLDAAEKARNISDIKFLTSLRIPNISEMTARVLLSAYGIHELLDLGETCEDIYKLTEVKDIGSSTSATFFLWFKNEDNVAMLHDLLREVRIVEESKDVKQSACTGLTFVVTGDVHIFKNREELKQYIFTHGGAVSGSVGKKTDYLINNDINSTSSKNKKAHELNVPIISEDEFVERFGSGN